MIGKLKGKVDSRYADYVIIDISGVGYLVYCSNMTLNKLAINEDCQLLIETHVREDHIYLFGFLCPEEKNLFNLLQSVNGIGTRMALTILSNLSPEQIQSSIFKRDKDAFKAISGVGSKLAERIIVELKDKICGAIVTSNHLITNQPASSRGIISDAILALTSLGVTKNEAQNLVQEIMAQNSDISINELITRALKARGG